MFECAGAPVTNPTRTNYVAVVGDGTIWSGGDGAKLKDVHQKSLMLVEVRESDIEWMEPRDVTPKDLVNDGISKNAVGGIHVTSPEWFWQSERRFTNVLLVDGSVVRLPDSVRGRRLAAMFSGGSHVREELESVQLHSDREWSFARAMVPPVLLCIMTAVLAGRLIGNVVAIAGIVGVLGSLLIPPVVHRHVADCQKLTGITTFRLPSTPCDGQGLLNGQL